MRERGRPLFGRVRYIREDGHGGEEAVALQDVVLAHIKRRQREREWDLILPH